MTSTVKVSRGGADCPGVPWWLTFILLSAAWLPIQVALHEAAHAFAALGLSDGEVSISMREASVSFEPASLRHPRDAAWIAAAGPAATLVAATVLWLAWLESGSNSLATFTGVGAAVATLLFLTSALPIRYGAGLNGPGDSDGRVIWRVLTGAPPGGIERELRQLGEPERAARPAFVAVLVLVAVLAFVMDPLLGLGLLGMFGLAALLQRTDPRR
jgi:hypothetical protein